MAPEKDKPSEKKATTKKTKPKPKKGKRRTVPTKKPPEQKPVEAPNKKRCGFCGAEVMWVSMHPGGKFKCPRCQQIGPASYFPAI